MRKPPAGAPGRLKQAAAAGLSPSHASATTLSRVICLLLTLATLAIYAQIPHGLGISPGLSSARFNFGNAMAAQERRAP
ncbi:MAG: hypothetical protein ACLQU1_36740 [Bryobacteraceae bacterium]